MTVVSINYFIKSDLYGFFCFWLSTVFAEYNKQWFVKRMQKCENERNEIFDRTDQEPKFWKRLKTKNLQQQNVSFVKN